MDYRFNFKFLILNFNSISNFKILNSKNLDFISNFKIPQMVIENWYIGNCKLRLR